MIAIPFAAGILLSRWQAPPVAFWIALFAVCVILLLAARGQRLLFILCVCLFLSGYMRGETSSYFPSNHIVHNFPKAKAVCEGKVITLPVSRTNGRRHSLSFRMRLESVYSESVAKELIGDVQVFHYGASGDEVCVGDYVRIRGELIRPRQATNPGELDYRRYLEKDNVFAVLRSYGSGSLRVTGLGGGLAVAVEKLRFEIKRRIDRILPYPENELLSALVIGERSGVSYDVRNLFMRTATTHLLAISGLHVSVIAGFFYAFNRFFGMPQKLNAALSVAILCAYAAVAGGNPPIQRAAIMSGIFFVGVLIERERNLINAIAVAFFLIIAANPRAIYQVGFQLSFISITSIVLLTPHLEKFFLGRLKPPEATSLLRIPFVFLRFTVGLIVSTLAATIGAFPVVSYYFNLFSPVGIIANLIAIPAMLYGLVMGITALTVSCVSVCLGTALGWGAVFLFRLTVYCLGVFSRIPFGTWSIPSPPLWIILLYYATILWLLFMKFRARPYLKWCAAAAIWLIAGVTFAAGSFKDDLVMTFLDTGRAQALHLKFGADKHWLINSGRGKPADNGRWIVAPFLRKQGVQRLTGVITTDITAKNCGGLRFVAKEFPCGYFFIHPLWDFSRDRKALIDSLKGSKTDIIRLSSTNYVYCPHENSSFRIMFDRVRRPLAVRLDYGSFRALLIPDGDSSLFSNRPQVPCTGYANPVPSTWLDGKCDLIWLPGNGKWMGEEENVFLRKLRPRFAVASGSRDRVDEKLKAILDEIGCILLDTSGFGAISVRTDGKEINISTFKDSPRLSDTL
ncbi:MAG: ComEC/Rec2 family competence protein [Candidatus Omnitrophica bacterium]|nr:ComEC/Rec2 family competence protein [Candidatus Omnitrophota bacterium]